MTSVPYSDNLRLVFFFQKKHPLTSAIMAVTSLSLCSLPVNAQVSIPGRLAQNICWYMSKGLKFNAAVKFAGDPKFLMLDERGVTPGYVIQNAQYILSDLRPWALSLSTEEGTRLINHAVVQTCPNRLSVDEYNVLIR